MREQGTGNRVQGTDFFPLYPIPCLLCPVSLALGEKLALLFEGGKFHAPKAGVHGFGLDEGGDRSGVFGTGDVKDLAVVDDDRVAPVEGDEAEGGFLAGVSAKGDWRSC